MVLFLFFNKVGKFRNKFPVEEVLRKEDEIGWGTGWSGLHGKSLLDKVVRLDLFCKTSKIKGKVSLGFSLFFTLLVSKEVSCPY